MTEYASAKLNIRVIVPKFSKLRLLLNVRSDYQSKVSFGAGATEKPQVSRVMVSTKNKVVVVVGGVVFGGVGVVVEYEATLRCLSVASFAEQNS